MDGHELRHPLERLLLFGDPLGGTASDFASQSQEKKTHKLNLKYMVCLLLLIGGLINWASRAETAVQVTAPLCRGGGVVDREGTGWPKRTPGQRGDPRLTGTEGA